MKKVLLENETLGDIITVASSPTKLIPSAMAVKMVEKYFKR